MKHCLDLDRQLMSVAEEKKELLGGDSVVLQDRCDKLRSALSDITCVYAGGTESPESVKGFLPLEEFLDTDVTCSGCFHHPIDLDALSQWFFNHMLAVIVFTIQVFGPLLVIIQLWSGNANPLNNPSKLWHDLTLKEMLCLGKDHTAILTTIMGTLFLIVVNMMIFSHCSDECDDAEKMARLPADRTWTILGNIAQCMCSCGVIIAAPVELWTETGVTGIMMNSMALLFVYSLDDLAGDIFNYIGDDDTDFQKQVAWNYALLANCPVNIRDLINPSATSAVDIWNITYNAGGFLMSQEGEVCETRIMIIQQETTPLVRKSRKKKMPKCHFEDVRVEYRFGPGSWPRQLPSRIEDATRGLWYVTKHVVRMFGIILPFIWFVCNKPCKPA